MFIATSALGYQPAAAQAPAPAALAVSEEPPAAAVQPNPNQAVYGGGLRARWVTLPGWFLGMFTKKNVPLKSSYGFAGEFFRRKGDMDIVVGLSYQKMGPPDGNWLGIGKAASEETDLVQFRNFAFASADVAFVWHLAFNDYIGMHYGAGFGLAIVTGEVLRTSAANCTEANAGDTSMCRPNVCPPSGCTETLLQATEGNVDTGPNDPHRFKEKSIPGAIPILNVLLGFNFKIPEFKGFEMRLEGGFYNAFFLGTAVGYAF